MGFTSCGTGRNFNDTMKFILGEKEAMSQIFSEKGEVLPVTIVHVSPNIVTGVRTTAKDGYKAVQVGMGVQKESRLSKSVVGHLKDITKVKKMVEFRTDSEMNRGDAIPLDQFTIGEVVDVTGVTKGKGFQGGVKRHGFHGGPRSHGQKHSEREVGSIGATGPQRVFKGKRMPGRMGGDQITVKNLKVVAIDAEGGKLYISGAVPGRRGTLLMIKTSK